jgi:hypothetical protein
VDSKLQDIQRTEACSRALDSYLSLCGPVFVLVKWRAGLRCHRVHHFGTKDSHNYARLRRMRLPVYVGVWMALFSGSNSVPRFRMVLSTNCGWAVKPD